MNLYNVIYFYPIGTKVNLKNNGEEPPKEIHGYEWFSNTGNILFRDGTKLSMNQLDQIETAHFMP